MQKINSLKEYRDEYELSVKDPEGFWADKASSFSVEEEMGQDP